MERRFSRVVRRILWLRDHHALVLTLTALGIATAFSLDLVIPGYAIAGFYLIPLLLAAFTLPGRFAVAVGGLCLALTVFVMVLQDRANEQNILLVWFAALAGAGLFALAYLYNRFDQLYESERSTTTRLQHLTAQVRTLQEAAVLDSARPRGDLLRHITLQAQQLLGSDAGRLFRLDGHSGALSLEAAVGPSAFDFGPRSRPVGQDAVGRAVIEHVAVADPDLRQTDPRASHSADRSRDPLDGGACLAVPLVVRQHAYGAIALNYRTARPFDDQDMSVAQAFGDQAALAIENARLREQVERSAVAAERSRLARELHDSVTQSLFAASLKAEALLCSNEPISPQASQGLDDLRRLTRGALAEMRTMLLEMRPDALTETPLRELLRHLVEAVESRSRLAVKLTASGRYALPAEVQIALYRIAQEALNNVVRHAQASHTSVTLRRSATAVKLIVADDGCGFDPARAQPEQLGLRTMRERAAAIQARLRVETRRRHGTVVTVEWPGEQA